MADIEVFLAVGADPAADPASWSFTDYTAKIREQQKVKIVRGKRARFGLVQTTTVEATADNTGGNLSRHNPAGANYGILKRHTPMRVDVDGVTRATAFLTGTPPRWDPSERDQTVTLNAVGVMSRLINAHKLGSALRRTLSGISSDGYRPLAYFPCEVGSDATTFPSAVAGPPLTPVAIPSGVTPGASSPLPGSAALPTWDVGTYCSFPVPGYTSTGQWIARWVVSVPAVPPGGNGYLARFNAQGTVVDWSLILEPGSPDQLALRGYDINGSEIVTAIVGVDSGDLSSEDEFYGRTFMVAVAVYQSGGNVVGQLTATRDDGLQLDVDTGTVAGTAGVLTGDMVLASVIDDQVMGHPSVVVDASFDLAAYFTDAGADNSSKALSGFTGELPHDRAARLAEEEGARLTVTGASDAAMGPQTPGTLLTNLRACELAGHGTLSESMDWGLALLLPSAQQNIASPAIQLDYAAGEIAPPWDPVDDDRQYANTITASRPSGGSYTAVDTDAVEAVGEAEAPSTNPALATDNQLADHAGWSLRLAGTDELLWPAMKPNFLAAPARLADWLVADIGSQLWVVNHPAPLAPDTIKQIIEGSSETYGSVSIDVSVILSPASPYTVAVADDDILGRADTEGMQLSTSITSTGTTLTALTTSGPLATTDPGEYPVDLRLSPDGRLSGEVVTATAIASIASDSFTRTVAAGSWGAMTSGQTWTLVPNTGSTSNYSVTTNRGRIAPSVTGDDLFAVVTTGYADHEVTGLVRNESSPASGTVRVGVTARYTDANNHYIAEMQVNTATEVTLRIIKRVSGSASVVASVGTGLLNPGGFFQTMRFRVIGSTLQARIWPEGTTEPIGWNITVTDTDLTTGNLAGFFVRNDTAVTTHAFLFDNWLVAGPQLITVTRSVNGVVRSWDAGTHIALAAGAVPAY